MNRTKQLFSQPLLLDGAMGTMLLKHGLNTGERPELLCLTAPDAIEQIHRDYFAAGAQVVYTNTFGASGLKLQGSGHTPDQVIPAAVAIARKAAADFGGLVALDIGPLGELLEPMGTLPFEAAYGQFREQILAGASGADLIVIETMTDLQEMRAALLAAKENSPLPVFCSMSFDEGGRTFTGCDVRAMALTLEGMGADAIGINCSLGPFEIYPIAQELAQWTNLPLLIKANAGLPAVENGETVYKIGPEEYARGMARFLDLGASILGGCCGTDPRYIAALRGSSRRQEPRFPPKSDPLCGLLPLPGGGAGPRPDCRGADQSHRQTGNETGPVGWGFQLPGPPGYPAGRGLSLIHIYTGISSSSCKRFSISKQRGAPMSSRLIPPKVGARYLTVLMISSVSVVSRQMGKASTLANALKRMDLPSITGMAASGPMLPRPRTAVPSVTTATRLPLAV